MSQLNKIFGIDLGTTYSCIAYVDEHGKPVMVPNAENQRTTPSVVFFDSPDNIIVGDTAKENAKLYPEQVVAFIKRAMGDPYFLFEYNNKNYRPEEISSYTLRKLVNDAQQNIGETITDVVITCPAYFGINEREATRIAGEIAGLNVRQIINEPTAAAVAYGSTEVNQNRVVLVYDLGGGTFDVTMISVKPEAIEVICTGGDHNLGGKDWDDRIIQHLVAEFQAQTGTTEDLLEDAETWQDLQLSAEKAKQTLTQREKAPVVVTHGGERAKIELTRAKFEEITSDLLERTISLTRDMLAEASNKGYAQFDELLLVGGSTRMPQVKHRVEQEFAVTVISFDPDEAVAKGAAIYGWKLSLNDELIKRIAESSGKTIEEVQENPPTEIPDTVAQQIADQTGYTLAAVKSSAQRISNVTSKSFGVVALDNTQTEVVVNLVKKNTTVPDEVTQSFFTLENNQTHVDIRVMENEVNDDTLPPEHAVQLGNAMLDLPANLPQHSPIQITFRLNEEGRLDMRAVEMSQKIEISAVFQTSSVIQQEELEEAKQRSQNLVIS